jgi:hypothetical protein
MRPGVINVNKRISDRRYNYGSAGDVNSVKKYLIISRNISGIQRGTRENGDDIH